MNFKSGVVVRWLKSPRWSSGKCQGLRRKTWTLRIFGCFEEQHEQLSLWPPPGSSSLLWSWKVLRYSIRWRCWLTCPCPSILMFVAKRRWQSIVVGGEWNKLTFLTLKSSALPADVDGRETREEIRVIIMNTYTHGDKKTRKIISARVCPFSWRRGNFTSFHNCCCCYVFSFYTGQKVTAPLLEKTKNTLCVCGYVLFF